RASSSRTHTQSGSGRDFGRGAGFAVAGYSRCSSSSSSRLSTTSQLVSPAALARCRHSATAVLPQPVARAIRRQLDTPANRCKRSMSLIFRIASLCWATVSLLGKRAKRGGEKGLRRDAPPAGGCYRSRAGDRGQRSEIMADSVPLRPPKCPRSGRNTVRHAAGMVSAIGSESCPSWAGTRNAPPMANDTIVSFVNPAFHDELSDLVREGAQRIIRQAVEAELKVFLEQHAAAQDAAGRRAVVRNGYQPERE